MSETPKEIFLCKDGWDLFEKWLKCAPASETGEDRNLWAEYYDHMRSCEQCQSLRKGISEHENNLRGNKDGDRN